MMFRTVGWEDMANHAMNSKGCSAPTEQTAAVAVIFPTISTNTTIIAVRSVVHLLPGDTSPYPCKRPSVSATKEHRTGKGNRTPNSSIPTTIIHSQFLIIHSTIYHFWIVVLTTPRFISSMGRGGDQRMVSAISSMRYGCTS
jgi:hypothetical protein